MHNTAVPSKKGVTFNSIKNCDFTKIKKIVYLNALIRLSHLCR